ncbi:hypothetical protein ACIA8K_35480 [Catenuloplanes sp. NPDC051500]|uniref:hypothetical protein n=1 Tax=Catenuloplanes sp. NPDC051500 TaxID=3363959 RepID=UPI00379E4548
MTDSAALAVPVRVEALAVNRGVRARDRFRWWQFNYAAFDSFSSPEPRPLDGSDGDRPPGIYLHWTLPDALRHCPPGGDFPLAPNRWLIVRTCRDAKVAGWVLESDCPVTTRGPEQGSLYPVDADLLDRWRRSADPRRSDGARTSTGTARLGVAESVATWTERAPTDQFLRAVAPANPVFAAYVPHHLGVFAFHDDLADVPDGPISYTVVGWYADPAADILANRPGYEDLEWTGTSAPATCSLYHGGVSGVTWEADGEPPGERTDPLEAVRDSGDLDVGIGDTAIDAFTALIAGRTGDTRVAELLRALQYDLLPRLNEINGDALLAERIRQEAFGSALGGYRWRIVSGDTSATDAEPAWLATLNADQAALDAALADLYGLQRDVHDLWFKHGYLSEHRDSVPAGVEDADATLEALGEDLDAGAARLAVAFARVQALRSQVPQPTDNTDLQRALTDGILAFAIRKGLDTATKTLRADAAPRYWHPTDPVVLVSGVEPPPSAVSDGPLTVRSTDAVVTEVVVDGQVIDARAVAALTDTLGPLDALPDGVSPLVIEAFLLDPLNAGVIAAATGIDAGALPAPQPWHQPWQPLFVEWSARYHHVPFDDGAWTFDGSEHRLTGTPPQTEPRDLSGISLLSPHPGTLFGARLTEFVRQYGTAEHLAALDGWLAGVGRRYLAQELTGFSDSLALRDVRAHRRPGPADTAGGLPLSVLTGYDDPGTPPEYRLPAAATNRVTTVPLLPTGPPPRFHDLRQGLAYLTQLTVYDRFGRVLTVVAPGESSGLFDYRNVEVHIDEALRPERDFGLGVASVLRLPPRLTQAARLDVSFVDDTPVGGWLLPSHLDRSLLLFAPDGTALGEYRILAGAGGTRTPGWQPPPHSDVDLDRVRRDAPHLHALITGSGLATEAGLTEFLAAIDETLWTTEPLGDRADQTMSVLIGRPLALLRTRLRFELDGAAHRDPGWTSSGDPALLGHDFPVRLGDRATREDGVIGYFAGSDYGVFHAVTSPGSVFVRGNDPVPLSFRSEAFVTIVADPRAAVHAYTGILPVKRCDLPAAWVDPALARMEISFRVGPLLTRAGPSPQPTAQYPTAVEYRAPAVQGGAWSWWERTPDGTAWTGNDLEPAEPEARLPQPTVTLHEGLLQLSADER